jgi:hypothetical protein
MLLFVSDGVSANARTDMGLVPGALACGVAVIEEAWA